MAPDTVHTVFAAQGGAAAPPSPENRPPQSQTTVRTTSGVWDTGGAESPRQRCEPQTAEKSEPRLHVSVR